LRDTGDESGIRGTSGRAFRAEPAMATALLHIDGIAMVRLLGPQDRLLTTLEREYPDVTVMVRGNEISLRGSEASVEAVRRLIEELLHMVREGQDLNSVDVRSSARMLARNAGAHPSSVLGHVVLTARGRSIRPKTAGQAEYVDSIDAHTIVFGVGPAGTGKTYLAMAKAVQALNRKEVNRIILTRPAVEAGERLGFLPGTLTDKIDPYLRPLYDALNEMMDPEIVPKLLEAGTVEVAPLAYMRGRTLNNSFIILDEAQNTTPEQMKMFLTRLGFGSRMILTGDITQIDLKMGASGLRRVMSVLGGIEDIHFSHLTADDVVRHPLVGQIVEAYNLYDSDRRAGGLGPPDGEAHVRPGQGRETGVNEPINSRRKARGHRRPGSQRPKRMGRPGRDDRD
jgi:phosphate starvation-inducible protein PhoH and related proteins